MDTLIRPLTTADIPQLVGLRQRCFQYSETASADALARKFHDIFIANPWRDASLPSLVHVEGGGITGFLGVVPRPMAMHGQPVRAAIATQFMVDPAKRGLTGVRLLRRFFRGPQDLSLSDVSNDESLALWEGFGGTRSLLHSIQWTKPLRPTRYGMHYLREHGLPRVLARAARPLCTLYDGIMARMSSGAFRHAPPTTSEDALDVDLLLSSLPAATSRTALVPIYDRESLSWLLQRLAEKQTFGRLRTAVVRDERGAILGWYLYFLNPGGISQVIAVAAGHQAVDGVLTHLSYEAWRGGAIAISGRLEPRYAHAFANRAVVFRCDGPWVLAHSANRDVLDAIRSGGAALSRLDAEWWLSF